MSTLEAPAYPGRRVGTGTARRLLAPVALSGRELVFCSLALGLLAAITFLGHVRHGGFYADDWGVLSLVKFPPHHRSGALETLWPYYGRRPGTVAWLALVDSTLGYDTQLQLSLAALMLLTAVLALYALLRALGAAMLHAALIAALVLVFPFSDALWLWAIESVNTFATALYVLGVLLALRAFATRGARALALHAASLALYLAALFSYESFAGIGCLVGVLYVWRAGWRRAWLRWAIDIVAVLGAVAISKLALHDLVTPHETQPLNGMLDHAGAIARAGGQIIAAAAVPFGSPDEPIVLGALAAVLLAAAAGWAALPRDDEARAALGRWLTVAAAGALIIVAAWAMYVPAISYYSPDATGTGNRVNGLAGIGIVLVLYAAAMLLGTLLFRALGHGRAGGAASVLAAGFAVFLGAGYIHRTSADSAEWDRAGAAQRRLLATMHRLVPRPPWNARFYVVDFHTGVSTHVPVFDWPWELASGIRSTYAARNVGGVVIVPGTRWGCHARDLFANVGGYAVPTRARYGSAFVLDADAARAVRVTSRAQCARLASTITGRPSSRG